MIFILNITFLDGQLILEIICVCKISASSMFGR